MFQRHTKRMQLMPEEIHSHLNEGSITPPSITLKGYCCLIEESAGTLGMVQKKAKEAKRKTQAVEPLFAQRCWGKSPFRGN